jgi:hypothetical protein
MDIELININKPEKSYIKQTTPLICNTLVILGLYLFIINKYFYKTFNLLDKSINLILVLSGMFLFYYCFVNFNSQNIMTVHYFIVLFIWFPILFCKNPALLSFFIFLIIVILIGWKINNGICMLGVLSWDIKINGKKYEPDNGNSPWRGVTFKVMLFVLLSKIIYYTYLHKKSK